MVCNVTLPTGEYVPLRAIEEVPKRDGLDHVALFDGLREEFSRAGLRVRNPINSDVTVLEDRCYFLPDRHWPDIVRAKGVYCGDAYVVLDKEEDGLPFAWMQFSLGRSCYTLKIVEVIDDYQGEGYGSFLLTFLVCCALQSGIDKIVIGSVTAEGVGLYSKMGFAPEGENSVEQWFSQHMNVRKEQLILPSLLGDESPIELDLNNQQVQDRVWGVFLAATHKLRMCR